MYLKIDRGDYFSIFDGKDLQSRHILQLDSNSNYNSTHKEKTVASTRQYMCVQFKTDQRLVRRGFKAHFKQIRIDQNCGDWLNTTALTLKTPDYPTINCNWIITTNMESTISISFYEFEVKTFHIMPNYFIQLF